MAFLIHLWHVFQSWLREHAKRGHPLARMLTAEPPRSSHWPAVEHAFRAQYPNCAACGSTQRLQIHHRQPFHLAPALELDPSNLISLCMSKLECHLKIGHGDNFRMYNPNVEVDAQSALDHPDHFDEIAARAKENRRSALGSG